MKYCLYVREDLALLKDDFFSKADLHGMKSDTYMYRDLRHFLHDQGIDLHTQWLHLPEESEVVLCLNETDYFVHYQRRKINRLLILILTEPPVYNRVDWLPERHAAFDKVLTYDADLVAKNPSKYVHINFPIDLDFEAGGDFPTEEEFKTKRLASLVAGAISINKGPESHRSLLHERYKVLKWYNQHAPSSLDFYARVNPLNKFECFRGASITNKLSRKLTLAIARYLFKKEASAVYKGAIPSLRKNEVLGAYKFNFCLENSHGIKGLISEKIFDCFMGRTIPIYCGAPDILHYVPKDCLLLYTDFKDLKDLHNFLEQMDYNTYLQYLKNAGQFLRTSKTIFSTQTFVQSIYQETKL